MSWIQLSTSYRPSATETDVSASEIMQQHKILTWLDGIDENLPFVTESDPDLSKIHIVPGSINTQTNIFEPCRPSEVTNIASPYYHIYRDKPTDANIESIDVWAPIPEYIDELAIQEGRTPDPITYISYKKYLSHTSYTHRNPCEELFLSINTLTGNIIGLNLKVAATELDNTVQYLEYTYRTPIISVPTEIAVYHFNNSDDLFSRSGANEREDRLILPPSNFSERNPIRYRTVSSDDLNEFSTYLASYIQSIDTALS